MTSLCLQLLLPHLPPHHKLSINFCSSLAFYVFTLFCYFCPWRKRKWGNAEKVPFRYKRALINRWMTMGPMFEAMWLLIHPHKCCNYSNSSLDSGHFWCWYFDIEHCFNICLSQSFYFLSHFKFWIFTILLSVSNFYSGLFIVLID